jgi:hypothetical protein
LTELPLTPAEPPGPRQRQRSLTGDPRVGNPIAPATLKTLPDLVLLDEAARPTGMVAALALPGARIPTFYGYWLSSTRPGALPDVSAIDPLLMPHETLPFMVVYAVEPEGGLRMRLIGTAVVDRTGADFTGRAIEPIGVMATLHARLTWCLQHRRPYLAHGQVPAAERDFIQFTALAAPFADRSGKVRRVVSVLQFIAPH